LEKLLVATNNQFKLKEIRMILGDVFEIVSLKDRGINVDIPETGDTFYENALIKAKTIFEMTGQLVLAEDSGLEVLELNNLPGVRSARYAGEPCNDSLNNIKLLNAMSACKNRTAKYTSAIVIYISNAQFVSFSGATHGMIATAPNGSNGFGYDPLFLSADFSYKKTFAQLSDEEKNSISHRSRALKQFLDYWVPLNTK
jgi:XTP/dITP diphosphohydrolase